MEALMAICLGGFLLASSFCLLALGIVILKEVWR